MFVEAAQDFTSALRVPLAAEDAPASATKGRVLVVDDELALARAYSRMLSAQGYDVKTSTDGLDASEILAQERFDAVVADVQMPGMTGIDLLRTSRRNDSGVPVILLTGGPTQAMADEAVESGALLFLVKPVDMRVLVQIVDHATKLRRLALLHGSAVPCAEPSSVDPDDRPAFTGCFDRAVETLRMVYQPIVHWRSRTIFGYEALARTEEPALANPAALIDAAERLGRVRDVGRVVRRRVAADMDGAVRDARVFVNIHTVELEDPELFSPSAPLSRHGARVVLEVTERASLHEVNNVAAKVAALRALGYRVAVDDLGAGYAGLTTFAQLLPEFVKIDMSLVRRVEHEPVKRELIRHLAQLCDEMGMFVVAEGVESCAERDVLREIGCDLMQGYLFARPGAALPRVTW